MSTRCVLCDGEYDAVTHAHLKAVHNITLDDYRAMFPHAQFVSEERRRQVSHQMLGNKHNLGKHPSNETRHKMSQSHIGLVQSVETKSKRAETLRRVFTPEIREKISKANKGKIRSPEAVRAAQEARRRTIANMSPEERKKKFSTRSMAGRKFNVEVVQRRNRIISQVILRHHSLHPVSQETRKKLSLVGRGRIVSDETRQKLSCALLGHEVSEEVRRRLAECHRGLTASEETKKKMSIITSRRWANPEFARRMSESWNKYPNKPESQLLDILEECYPNQWEYVGNGTLWIAGKNPDFTSKIIKEVIEVFGVYWHNPRYFPKRMNERQLIKHYRDNGYNCLVFWQYDVYDKELVTSRISNELEGI